MAPNVGSRPTRRTRGDEAGRGDSEVGDEGDEGRGRGDARGIAETVMTVEARRRRIARSGGQRTETKDAEDV